MLLTALAVVLTATDVQTAPPTEAPPPRWAVHYTLSSPAVVGASFAVAPPTSGLGSLTRPAFSNSLVFEHTLGGNVTGVALVTFGYEDFGTRTRSVSGGVTLGARWYLERPFEGFWAGPELNAQLITLQLAQPAGTALNTAVGVRGRVGWTQRFGAHFLVTASASLGGNYDWSTGASAQQTVNVTVDGSLAAGVLF